MELLKELFHIKDFNINGKTITREAVRGIIIDENDKKLLMIYTTADGEYKFPGGGVEYDETYEEALRREIREECGANVSEIGMEFGKVIEYIKPVEEDVDVFIMTSYYYVCKVDSELGSQKLEQYELDLGFSPVWVDIDVAIDTNNEIVLHNIKVQRWTGRDAFILEQVKQKKILDKVQKYKY